MMETSYRQVETLSRSVKRLFRRPPVATGKDEAETRTRSWDRLSPGEWW